MRVALLNLLPMFQCVMVVIILVPFFLVVRSSTADEKSDCVAKIGQDWSGLVWIGDVIFGEFAWDWFWDKSQFETDCCPCVRKWNWFLSFAPVFSWSIICLRVCSSFFLGATFVHKHSPHVQYSYYILVPSGNMEELFVSTRNSQFYDCFNEEELFELTFWDSTRLYSI